MYDSGALNKSFLFDIAITEMAPGKFLAAKFSEKNLLLAKSMLEYSLFALVIYYIFF